jgi:prepilin-type N-terminal cleavage/methylation domain-containing protein
MQFKKSNQLQSGFTLIETIVAIAVFSFIAFSVYQTYITILRSINLGRQKVIATELANEKIEIIRNLSYANVGLINGIPNGIMPHIATTTRNNNTYTITTTIRNIDDPFDGVLGGTPNDSAPSDYKYAQVDIACPSCNGFASLPFYTWIAPAALEGSTTNGALFVQVLNSSGQPVVGANVHVENLSSSTNKIIIDDITNNIGMLQIVDTPPGTNAYDIIVTKAGYSTDRTYRATTSNPTPTKAPATILAKKVTQITFSIDVLGNLAIVSKGHTCAAISHFDFNMTGAKTIGVNLPKFSATTTTDDDGLKTITNLEWDVYNLTNLDAVHALIGTIPLLPLNVAPGSSNALTLVLRNKDPNAILAIIKDGPSGLPLTGATVTLTKAGVSQILTTGQGYMRQSDWSGGAGQEDFTNETKFSSVLNLDPTTVPGQVQLTKNFGSYVASGYLISSTYDAGTSSNYSQINWSPLVQVPQTGTNSVKFQFASNNDNLTWDFTGPDGTASTYYTATNSMISTVNNNQQYARYKMFLSSPSTSSTPIVSDVSFTFSSGCLPPGQVYYDELATGAYTLTASKTAYQTASTSITITAATPWQQKTISLFP